MKTLKVPDMHCEMCVKRISKALGEAGVAFEIDLKKQSVSVDESKTELAVSELEDLGFSVAD